MTWFGRTTATSIFNRPAPRIAPTGQNWKQEVKRGWDGTPLVNDVQVKKVHAKATKEQQVLNAAVKAKSQDELNSCL